MLIHDFFTTSFLSLLLLLSSGERAAQTAKPRSLPVKYEAHRFFVEPVTTNGAKLKLYTDTGGGLFLFREAVERLHLQTETVAGDGPEPISVVSLPEFAVGFSIPLPLGNGGKIPVMTPPSGAPRMSSLGPEDGMLGQEWFGGRVWTFDYPKHELLLREAGDVPNSQGHQIPLGFKTDSAGRHALNFARIQASIDGEDLDLLFDTGATTILSESALAALQDGVDGERATSFITATTFAKWQKRHPEWRVEIPLIRWRSIGPQLARCRRFGLDKVAVQKHVWGPHTWESCSN